MDVQHNIQMRSVARVEAEVELMKLHNGHLNALTSGKDAKAVKKQHAVDVDFCVGRYCKASCQELSARLLQLPRELRDMIYNNIWNFPSCISVFLNLLFHNHDDTLKLAPPCLGSQNLHCHCSCLQRGLHFLDTSFMGKEAALEIVEAYQQEVRKRAKEDHYATYRIHWKDMEAFATRDIIHLGLTVHQLLENFHLVIDFGCLGNMGIEATLDVLGIPGGAGHLNKFVDAMCALSKEKPRPVTFALHDKGKGLPTNLDHVLCKLSIPFHQLRNNGFDMRVTYRNLGRLCYSGLGKWELGSDGWDWPCRPGDVWNWSIHDWNLNFTRANEYFQPSALMGDSFCPNPNGPLEKHRGDLRAKIPLWEGIRKYLYRSFPDSGEAVVLVRRKDGKHYVDCGCDTGRHSCSNYFLCEEHGGWDRDVSGRNTYCYKCCGIESSR